MENKFFDFISLNAGDLISLAKNIVVSIIIAVAGLLVSRALRKLVDRAPSGKMRVDDTVKTLLHYVIRYGILIITVIMILNVFGINTASLIAVLGAAGVAVGLALRDTLSNIAAGIILLLLGSYRRGEAVEFGSYTGTVKEINLFTTILETPDGLYISAPNSSVLSAPLKNFSRNGKRRMELSVRIAFSDSIDAAFQAMREIIGAERRFFNDPPPQIIVQSVGESSVTITLRAWASVQDYWDIYWDQMKNIKAKIEEAGLHVPFPRQEIHIIEQPKNNQNLP